MKTALLAAISVVVAIALIFAGTLLGAAIPGLDSAAQRILSNDGGSAAEGGSGGELDVELQEEIFQKLESTFFEPIDADILSRSAIDGMLAGLDDPYTYYFDPEEYASLVETTSGEYSGVGMVLMMNGLLPTVVSVFEGSPAAEAGIKGGDIVLAVAGSSTQGLTLMQVVSDIKGEEGSEVQLKMYRPAAPLSTTTTLTAEGGSDPATDAAEAERIADTATVDLTQVPEGGSDQTYTLTRRTIVVPTTTTTIMDDKGKKVAHIVLSTFASEKAAAELRSVVETAIYEDKVDAIVLDIRGNGGGLLDQAVEVASIFIDSGVIVSTKGLHYPEEQLQASGDAISPDIPLYLLVDGYSASASEILAGALQDYARAALLGETTFGKGLVQNIEPLSNGGAVKVTIAVYLTPKGRDINETGITPDVVAPDDPATEDVDETLEKALDLIASGG